MLGNSITNIGSLTFSGCSGLTSITIPDSVARIGSSAFSACGLTGISIPNSVTSIGDQAFSQCSDLTDISVDTNNQFYSSLDGVLFDKSQTTLIQYPDGKAGSYTVPNRVTSIGQRAFQSGASLTSVTIPNSVTSIGDEAFAFCSTNLTSIYFKGNAPNGSGDVFYGDDNATVYYLPGTTGWSTNFGGLPTASWVLPYPVILTIAPSFAVQTNGFGFTISWATNIPVVVEASTNLGNPIWTPVATNTLTGGSSYFSDPQWTNYPSRFYRLRWP